MYFLSRLMLLAAFATIGVCVVALAMPLHPWSTILIGFVLLKRTVRKSGLRLWGHGTARWAGSDDLKRAKMI